MYEYTKPRMPILAMFSGPGPSVYFLPTLCGFCEHDTRSGYYRNPMWSLVGRNPCKVESSVGPKYNINSHIHNNGYNTTPLWSMAGANWGPKPFVTPAPWDYNYLSLNLSPAVPMYSFGSRTKGFRLDQIPAANIYTLDPMLGKTIRSGKKSAPYYFIGKKLFKGGFLEDLSKSPGPAAYQYKSCQSYPQYSILGKWTFQMNDDKFKPGPGTYNLQHVWVNKKKGPEYSFGIRHSCYKLPLITALDADIDTC